MSRLRIFCLVVFLALSVAFGEVLQAGDIADPNLFKPFIDETELDVDVPSNWYAHYPRISEDYAVYAVGGACDYTWYIRYKKIGSDVIKNFGQYGLSTNPDVEGNIVVWQGDGKTFGPNLHEPCLTSIYMGKLSTGDSEVLAFCDVEDQSSYSHPAISGDKVVWLEHLNLDARIANNPANWFNTSYNICGADISNYNNPVFFTVDSDVGNRDPYPYRSYGSDFDDVVDISDNIVVWEGRGDIYGADISDISNIRIFTICDDPFLQNDPAVSGNTVVWTDYRDQDNVRIYAADISDINNIEEFVITPDDGKFIMPAIDNNVIVYVEDGYTNFIRASMLIRDNLVLELPISENCMGLSPDICGDNIIWQTASYGRANAISLRPYYSVVDGAIENINTGERYDFIRDAIHLSNDGDEIVVPTGTYTTAFDFEDKNITLRSSDPLDANIVAATIISDCNVGVTFAGGQDANCCLEGFTITDSNVGFYCYHSEPTIRNCNITGNYIKGCDIYYSNPTITNCKFYENQTMGMYIRTISFPTIQNCLITKNSEFGVYCSNDGSPDIRNCTIVDNLSGGLYFRRSKTNAYVTNSIIWNNTLSQISGTLTIPKVTHCDVEGGFDGLGNIDCDPMFADVNNNDYHLKSQGLRFDSSAQAWVTDGVTSGCIDAGNPGCSLGDEALAMAETENTRINLGYFGGTGWASLGPIGASLLADINNDKAVDLVDMDWLTQYWLISEAEAVGDLNRDGVVNLDDFALLAK